MKSTINSFCASNYDAQDGGKMTLKDLKIVQKYDVRGSLLGVYNNIFIQDGCARIKDDFVVAADIEEEFFRSMLADFDIYDGRVIASYNASSIGGTTVYHVSYGQMGRSSLSVFFRIYAVEVDAAGGVIQPPNDELYFVANINIAGGRTTIKLRRKISNINVDMTTGIFTNGRKRYRAVMEITGVGSHEGRGATYRLVARNENLFAGSSLTL